MKLAPRAIARILGSPLVPFYERVGWTVRDRRVGKPKDGFVFLAVRFRTSARRHVDVSARVSTTR